MLTTFQMLDHGSSSPNNRTIDTKEEKQKVQLGEACHGTLAGSVLGLKPAAARLGLSIPRLVRKGWLPPSGLPSPFRAAC